MKQNKNRQILLRLSEDELEQIQNNAKATDKNLSAYIRETALNMCIVKIDHFSVTQHTEEIIAYKNAINQLIFTIKRTGKYTPLDLEYIQDKTNELLKSEKEFLNTYQNSIEKEKNRITRTVKNIVNKMVKS